MTDGTKSIVLVGVGGQGTILASRILTEGLIMAGYDVKMSEIHGMSQRGGSVSTSVRYGRKVWSPVIGEGEADVLVSFEAMEAMRALNMLKKGGKAVVSRYEQPSLPIQSGKCAYPAGIPEAVAGKTETVIVDAAAIAKEQGNPRGMNMVMLGALIEAAGLDGIDWESAVCACVKQQYQEANIRCLEAGRRAAGSEGQR